MMKIKRLYEHLTVPSQLSNIKYLTSTFLIYQKYINYNINSNIPSNKSAEKK